MGILFIILAKCLVVTDLDPNTVLRVPMLESRDNLIDNRDLKMSEVWPSLVLAHDCIVCYHYLVTSILADIKSSSK